MLIWLDWTIEAFELNESWRLVSFVNINSGLFWSVEIFKSELSVDGCFSEIAQEDNFGFSCSLKQICIFSGENFWPVRRSTKSKGKFKFLNQNSKMKNLKLEKSLLFFSVKSKIYIYRKTLSIVYYCKIAIFSEKISRCLLFIDHWISNESYTMIKVSEK
jgi:hypothetical protein